MLHDSTGYWEVGHSPTIGNSNCCYVCTYHMYMCVQIHVTGNYSINTG